MFRVFTFRTAFRTRLVVLATGLGLLLGGAGLGSPALAVVPADTPPAGPWYLEQAVNWTACEEYPIMNCATVKLPLDWRKPGGARIKVALSRLAATNKPAPLGAVLVNPGGPGASGVAFVGDYMAGAAGYETLRSNYDIIGFDPRGVGNSSAVRCVKSVKQMDKLFADSPANTNKGRKATAKSAKAFAKRCAKLTGPLLGYVDSVSVVKDMDAIRGLLGQDKLNYLGYSYGTKLGAYYAELFPDRVGRFVLDGAVDPSKTGDSVNEFQLRGFNKALKAFAKESAKRKGYLGKSTKAVLASIKNLMKSIETKPMVTDYGIKLTSGWAHTGLIMGLYSKGYWNDLRKALVQAAKRHDGTGLINLAFYYADRTIVGYVSNDQEAFLSINCLDYGGKNISKARAAKAIRNATKISPILGAWWAGNGIGTCSYWRYKATGKAHKVTSTTTAPILIIGTTGDPATPYEQAVSLSKQLTTSRLLTFRGEGHTVYPGNSCVNRAVNHYFRTGVLPAKGQACS